MPSPVRRAMSALSLATLVVIFSSGGAEAEIIIGGTTVQPVGDPVAYLHFGVELNPLTYPLVGDNIELFNVVDLDTTVMPIYAYKVGDTDYSSYFKVIVGQTTIDTMTHLTYTDVTLQYIEPPHPRSATRLWTRCRSAN